MAKDYAVIKRELELEALDTYAYIHYRRDGGPIYDLVTGREPHPVGQTTCLKAGMRGLVWESFRAERPMFHLCEVASPVHAIAAQPHILEMKVTGEPKNWLYRPDLHLEVDAVFADMIANNIPFAQAVADWRPNWGDNHKVALIVEVKNDEDRRNNDSQYQLKLELAKKVYENINWRFTTVVRSRDVEMPRLSTAVDGIMFDHDVSITPGDIDLVRNVLPPRPYAGRLDDVIRALGGGATGRGKAASLHVRRIISIDLTLGLDPDTPVRRLEDELANFEMEGRYPW
ncbi:hypothetical protein NO932_02480 [Pelagibacterium sp. 26DY04]|uniref:hypothetical protein n=1 Tax=Pelagibacterium sp. 26DY04 TaxID=2967130 RepID=UPI002816392A|nr:hypothetical protein [Pelagibacterium sp. 26DY04]WMT87487.1 hypothetical protein NO932_02480 [Pelagibacterium sp. 26DY04]